jgi:glutaredoxin-like protein nrdH
MKIIVYSKPNCMQCEFTKRVLREANIDFEVRDVSVSEKALEEVRKLNFKALPVVNAEGHKAFAGFRPDLLEKIVQSALSVSVG